MRTMLLAKIFVAGYLACYCYALAAPVIHHVKAELFATGLSAK